MRTDAGATAATAGCQYPALVALSAQRDVTALHTVLLDGLRELLPGARFGLYLRDPIQGQWRAVVAADTVAGERIPPAVAQLLTAVTELPADGGEADEVSRAGYTALAVRSGHRVLAAVLVADPDGVAADDTLQSLLSIYGNQLGLLHRSRSDALTGLLNRQTLEETMARLFGEASWRRRRNADGRGQWCVALLDIDHFKRINDSFGHLYGDEVLVLLAQLMRNTFRDEDLLFRYGGEEFLVLLSDVEEASAAAVLERFRGQVEGFAFPQVGRVTVSVGFTLPEAPLPGATVLAHADQALYFAKANGRNQVRGYERLVADGDLPPDAFATPEDIELF